eukprot:gene3084-3855_t
MTSKIFKCCRTASSSLLRYNNTASTKLYTNTLFYTTTTRSDKDLNKNSGNIQVLDQVLEDVKNTNSTNSEVYNLLLKNYLELKIDTKCADVFVTAHLNKVENLDQDLIKAFEQDLKIREEDDNNPSLDSLLYIREDYKKFKEANTRRPWLNPILPN